MKLHERGTSPFSDQSLMHIFRLIMNAQRLENIGLWPSDPGLDSLFIPCRQQKKKRERIHLLVLDGAVPRGTA